jgi:hypothetical protein
MDQSEEAGLPLDGNAAAGLLCELFALDVTAAKVMCDSCGVVTLVGETRVYGGVMEYFAALTATAFSCG